MFTGEGKEYKGNFETDRLWRERRVDVIRAFQRMIFSIRSDFDYRSHPFFSS